jgi:transcriptional regulator with XRE-family HTH domain
LRRRPVGRGNDVTLGERLKLVRGTSSQKSFAAELSLHENTVSNAERRNSATLDYLQRLAAVRNINLHWLITGHGPMRVGEADGSLLQEKVHLALAEALRAAYGSRYAAVPLETRARALRAGATYLRAIGVTAESLPGPDALSKLLRLTIEVMRSTGPAGES